MGFIDNRSDRRERMELEAQQVAFPEKGITHIVVGIGAPWALICPTGKKNVIKVAASAHLKKLPRVEIFRV